ncbi:MAG TPA: SMI1/KNR4 family protein [Streptosporangiaceae bacterium]|nr:SMI1/KNR4 family protein [Streptosporangiaceae bacterium]
MVASEAQVRDVEQHFGVRFPDDYRRFLATQGSMGRSVPPVNDCLMVDPVEKIIEINEAGEIQDRFPGAVVIGGDGSRELLTYDFRQEPPVLVLLDITAEDWSDALYQASSLTELLRQFPDRGWSWEPIVSS